MTGKICIKCGVNKPYDEYYGRHNECKVCLSKYNANRKRARIDAATTAPVIIDTAASTNSDTATIKMEHATSNINTIKTCIDYLCQATINKPTLIISAIGHNAYTIYVSNNPPPAIFAYASPNAVQLQKDLDHMLHDYKSGEIYRCRLTDILHVLVNIINHDEHALMAAFKESISAIN